MSNETTVTAASVLGALADLNWYARAYPGAKPLYETLRTFIQQSAAKDQRIAELEAAMESKVLVSRDLVEATVSVLSVVEKKNNRVDDWKLSDMREELSANLIGESRARNAGGR
jgi:hypothetical protein